MTRYSLDTNTLSYIILRKERAAIGRFMQARSEGHEFILCPMVYYEIRRLFIKRNASTRLRELDAIVSHFLWREFNRDIWLAAAQGWAEAERRGRPCEDADLLIAYHAHHHAAVLVTNNVKDFQEFPVALENWV